MPEQPRNLRRAVDGARQVREDLTAFTKDWRRLQTQKYRLRGGVEARMLLALGLYFGEHAMVQARDAILSRSIGGDDDRNRLNLVFNLIRKATKKRIGRIWSVAPEFGASPDKIDPRSFDNADVVTDLIRGLNFKLGEKLLHWQRIWWAVTCGVSIEHTPWIEDITEEPIPAYDPETNELLWKEAQSGRILPHPYVLQLIERGVAPERFTVVEHLATVGDVGSQIISPLNFFIDSSVRTIKDLPSDQACYIVECKTVDWVRSVFGSEYSEKITSRAGDDLSVVRTKLLDKGPTLASMNLRDLVPAVTGSKAIDDPPLALVATRYQPSTEQWPHGRRTIFVPDQVTLDDGETPYGEIPCVDYHYDAPTVSFWTSDFITDMAPAQKFLNKRMSQMGESANATVHEILLLGGELEKADIPSDLPGVIEDGLDESGNPRVQMLQRHQLPPWFLQSIQEVVNFLHLVGGSDLLQTKQFPGQLRGPLALPMLQELLDSEDGPFFSHLGEQLARVHQQRVNRVKQFYPPIRTLHYTGRNNKDETLVFHNDAILKSGTNYTIVVDQSSLVPELSALRRARVIEDLSGPAAILYTDSRTGQLSPSKIAIAMRYTDREVETRMAQARKLAGHLIARLWQGEPLPEHLPFPNWDHTAILDEMDAAMHTTEFLEASAPTQQNFFAFYERCRAYLASIQQAQMNAVQNQMMQGAVAQATQQAAAKAAAVATDAALGQIEAGRQAALPMSPEDRMASEIQRERQQLPPAPRNSAPAR